MVRVPGIHWSRDLRVVLGPAVKDLCWTQGIPTAAGMTIYKDFRPAEDASVVRKLYAAGAVIFMASSWLDYRNPTPA